MNVLSLSPGQDTGGQAIRLKHAFDRYTEWTYRAVVRMPSYMAWPTDLRYQRRRVRALCRAADVIHTHNGLAAQRMVDPHLRKPSVIHHHGTLFRTNPRHFLAEAGTRLQLVSTLDLWLIAPKRVEWLPSPQDLAYLAAIREHHYRPEFGTVRIAHAPTARRTKGTDSLIAAVKILKSRYPLELDVIEFQKWTNCLARKARADIYFDQPLVGFGNNALEAWAMGMPVVAGTVADPRIADAMRERFGELPYYPVTDDTPAAVVEALEPLIADAALRAEYADKGLRYVREYHDDQKVMTQFADACLRAIDRKRKAA